MSSMLSGFSAPSTIRFRLHEVVNRRALLEELRIADHVDMHVHATASSCS